MASRLGLDVDDVFARRLAGNVCGIIWWLVFVAVFVIPCVPRLLCDLYFDAFNFVFGSSLPWAVGLVCSIWWGHPVASAVWAVWVSLDGVVSMRFQEVLDNVMVRMVIENMSPGEAWDFDIMADP